MCHCLGGEISELANQHFVHSMRVSRGGSVAVAIGLAVAVGFGGFGATICTHQEFEWYAINGIFTESAVCRICIF